MVKKNEKAPNIKLGRLIKSVSFQRVAAVLIAFIALSSVVSYESAPKKYKLSVGDISQYDINAPRDIENTIKTRQNAEKKAAGLEPTIVSIEDANDNITSGTYDYFDSLLALMGSVIENVNEAENTGGAVTTAGTEKAALAENVEKTGNTGGSDTVEAAQSANGTATPGETAITTGADFKALIRQFDTTRSFDVLIQMSGEKLHAFFTNEGVGRVENLKSIVTKGILPDLKRRQLMEGDLDAVRAEAVNQIKTSVNDDTILAIADDLLKKVLVPNSRVDEVATEEAKNAVIDSAIKDDPVIIYKDERIISKDDIVTADIFEVLKELNYIDSEGKPDYFLYAAVVLLIFVLAVLTAMYLKTFHAKLYGDKNSVMLIGVAVLITTLFAWLLMEFIPDYAHLLIPTLVAPVITAIFLGIQPAITVNLFLTFSYSLMLGGNIEFVFMSLVSGTFAAYLTVNATQRRKISLAGAILGGINALTTVLTGILEKKSIEGLLNEGGLAFVNGIFSIVLAIGILPFLESVFNIVTPLKLLELADPNHPLLKRLLMEAPGTYHHSLMVGNLAEVATREIGGNSLLARVGAYFHDVGKLKRPNFFKENQMYENPHDRLTPNLSVLIITSHTREGEELGIKYKLPKVIRDIIKQHHGTTLVAYFYHKASQNDKIEEIKETNFRYDGPLPDTREAAVVLLADSVEAAVRAMPEKTKGKIEGLVRKIIKDKLDDGQLDHCDLTLKDLSLIAGSFMQVLSGVFHERPEYPEYEKRNSLLELDNEIYNLKKEGGRKVNEDSGIQPAESHQIIQGDSQPY